MTYAGDLLLIERGARWCGWALMGNRASWRASRGRYHGTRAVLNSWSVACEDLFTALVARAVERCVQLSMRISEGRAVFAVDGFAECEDANRTLGILRALDVAGVLNGYDDTSPEWRP